MTGSLFKSLRHLKVLVIHPENNEGKVLIQQLTRIGCQVEAAWPYPKTIPVQTDVVFIIVEQESLPEVRFLFQEERGIKTTIIAMVDYENPTVLQTVIDIGSDAVITTPVRPLGVLTNLVVARQAWTRDRKYKENIKKIERKMRSMRKLNQAKTILMNSRGINEEEAHKLIREQAMAKRVTTEEIATSIINANELLQVSLKSV